MVSHRCCFTGELGLDKISELGLDRLPELGLDRLTELSGKSGGPQSTCD